MKKTIYNIVSSGAAFLLLTGLGSCSADQPFETSEAGEGTLRMTVTVNHSVTRADEEDATTTETPAPDKCRIQITKLGAEGNKITHQYQSQEAIPKVIRMTAGNYVAEAWGGDSLPVSLGEKFYAGYEPFSITSGGNTSVALNCKIRNVVVALDCSYINTNPDLTDFNVKVWHKGGSISFRKGVTGNDTSDDKNLVTSLEEHGYFMMPTGVKVLDYEITGTFAGAPFKQTGTLTGKGDTGVKPAHQYNLKFKYGAPELTQSGGAINIKVDFEETEIQSDERENSITAPPTITGFSGFDLADAYSLSTNTGNLALKAICFKEFKEFSMNVSDSDKDYFGFSKGSYDLTDTDDINELKALGIDCVFSESVTTVDDKPYLFKKAYITFSRNYLSTLGSTSGGKEISVKATDGEGRSAEAVIKIKD